MTLKKLLVSFLTGAGFLAVIIGGVLWGNFSGAKVADASFDVTNYAITVDLSFLQ